MSDVLTRRGFLRLAGFGTAVALGAACAPATPPAPTSAPPKPAPTAAAPAPAPTAPPKAAAVAPGAPADWEAVVAAARKEGVVVVAGPPGELYRTALLEFGKDYSDIKVEYTGVSGRDFSPKILAERDAGQYLWDVHVGGAGTPNFQLKPKAVFDPIAQALALPEVLDDSKWLGGFKAGFMDKEGQFVYGFQGALLITAWVNRDNVPEAELNSIEQLVEPNWKGKISWNDPRVTGDGASTAGHFLMVLGEDFLRRLYAQDLAVTTDLREQTQAIVRGAQPIAIGMDATHLAPFRAQGLGNNVKAVNTSTEAGSRLSPGWGNAMLVNRAPHPNASKVFLNWLLSSKGQSAWAQTSEQSSRRLDVANPPSTAPDPKATYRVVNHESLNQFQDRASTLAKELIK